MRDHKLKLKFLELYLYLFALNIHIYFLENYFFSTFVTEKRTLVKLQSWARDSKSELQLCHFPGIFCQFLQFILKEKNQKQATS